MHELLLEFLIIAVSTVVLILSGAYWAFVAIGVHGGYDANECFRLMRVIDDKEVRQELTDGSTTISTLLHWTGRRWTRDPTLSAL